MAVDPERCAERLRLEQDERRECNWKRWGPYLSERQWGTVREDYSEEGDVWNHLTHEQARHQAYRWGEDGLLGITDRQCRLSFALALWNGRDPFLKERLFGLTGPEGNHGEDVKEQYFYLDSTPTHSYMKALYKYPQAEFPYSQLLQENQRRGKTDPEYELADTGVFAEDRYFDIFAEYAKAGPDDLLIRIRAINRGPETASLHLLPTLWFRNTWSWGCLHEGCWIKPSMRLDEDGSVVADQATLGRYRLHLDREPHSEGQVEWKQELLFTENESDLSSLYGTENEAPYVKSGFHRRVVDGAADAVHPDRRGTKMAAWYEMTLAPGASTTVQLRLHSEADAPSTTHGPFGEEFDQIFNRRQEEADRFYATIHPDHLGPEQRRVCRQAYAGLLWTKQFYHYVIHDWLEGDPDQPPPPAARKQGRNADWGHLFNRDIISMPDKWEYPWYAAWDLAFHMLPFASIDSHFAKDQIGLFLREWYMHPNGQLPAYEWDFGDVNPPVHAWAAWRLYKMTGKKGERDVHFLKSVFSKLLLNFTWWVNRKDPDGRNLFAGGFLGLDNIGVFDRSRPLPGGSRLEQADGTAWMAFYSGTMLSMALELALEDPVWEDMASKFFEHFIYIVDAMNHLDGTGLWDEEDGFYYDRLHADEVSLPLKVRSMVGLIPLFAVEVLDQSTLDRLPGFRKRLEWFLENRRDLAQQIGNLEQRQTIGGQGRLLAVPSRERLERVLRYLLDEEEFLSPYGVRSLSRVHRDQPFVLDFDGEQASVAYVPGESDSGMFGGNSNWRGPIWLPVNYLLVEALQKYHYFYGDTFTVECPTGSGRQMNLRDVARELARRLSGLFLPDEQGRRPCHGGEQLFERGDCRDLVLFHEYFHGDTGKGLGASHQTGWTALVARLLEKSGS